jgi:hypothetical protein
MPYTHSLPGSIVLSLIFGGIVAVFTTTNRWATILLVAAASFSHWVLDLVVHTPDLPLYDKAAKVTGCCQALDRAAFDEAVKRRPGRIVTLRQKTRVLADSRRQH